jgi:hypothetical protein
MPNHYPGCGPAGWNRPGPNQSNVRDTRMALIEPTIADGPGCYYYVPKPLPAAELSRFYQTACGKTAIWHGERELPGYGFMVDVFPNTKDLLSLWRGEVCGYSISTDYARNFGLVWIISVLVFRHGQGFQEDARLRRFVSHDEKELRANGIGVCPGWVISGSPRPNWAAGQTMKEEAWECRLLPHAKSSRRKGSTRL